MTNKIKFEDLENFRTKELMCSAFDDFLLQHKKLFFIAHATYGISYKIEIGNTVYIKKTLKEAIKKFNSL
jgi:hypothetical protein